MPKATARRTSGPTSVRAEPYPAIRPGDKPTTSKANTSKKVSTKKSSAPSSTLKGVHILSEQTSSDTNAASSSTLQNASSFLDIVLDGETDGSIKVYDTCSTVRQKINALLGKDNHKPENGNPHELDKNGKPKPFTKASFLRAINGGRSDGLTRFLKAKQMMGGAENQVYPKAYAFFEKKRIFEGKKKTNTRLKVESDRPNGLPLRDPNRMYITCATGENPRDFLDEYGQ